MFPGLNNVLDQYNVTTVRGIVTVIVSIFNKPKVEHSYHDGSCLRCETAGRNHANNMLGKRCISKMPRDQTVPVKQETQFSRVFPAPLNVAL